MLLKICYIVLILMISIYSNNCEYIDDLYSSVPALEKSLNTESFLLKNSQIFFKYFNLMIELVKSKISALKSKSEIQLNLKEKLQYKRALDKFKEINYKGFSKIKTNFEENYLFPTTDDLDGVTLAFERLGDVYQLSAKDIAEGNFLDIKNSKTLSSDDCFEMGRQLFASGKLEKSEEWLNLAYELYIKGQKGMNIIELWKILDFIGRVKFKQGGYNNIQEAIKFTRNSFKLNPKSNELRVQLKWFEDTFKDIKQNYLYTSTDYKSDFDLAHAGCRGKFQKLASDRSQLYCTYKYGKHPFLKIAPLKLEVQNINPYLGIFHDVINGPEIEYLQESSLNELKRALVWNPSIAKSVPANYRTSKIAWLSINDYPYLGVLNQRLEDMTDMSMTTSELLQVMNYGIGGHYDVHHDYFPEPNNETNVQPYYMYESGNRLATVLFYLSDVEQGGATVYPYTKTALYPKKGNAAFWFNLHPSGDGDQNSMHAACPVIFGSKWVANKWIRYNGQMFLRPCKLNKDDNFEAYKLE